MGRKRKYNTKKMKLDAKEKTFLNELAGGFVIVIGLALFVFLKFRNIGSLAVIISYILKGALGKAAYCMPAIFVFLGCKMIAKDDRIYFLKELLKGFLVAICFSTLLYTFTLSNTSMFSNFAKFITETIEQSASFEVSYGIFGGIIGSLIVKAIGSITSRVLLLFLTFMFSLLFIDVSIQEFFVGIYNAVVWIINIVYDVLCKLFAKDEDIKVKEINLRKEREKKKRVQTENIKTENYIEENYEVPVQNAEDDSKKKRRGIFNAKIEDPEIEEKMTEKTSKDVMNYIKSNQLEQVKFDFDKLAPNNISNASSDAKALEKKDDFFKKQIEKKEDKDVKEVLTIDHTALEKEEVYTFPPIELLGINKNADKSINKRAIHDTAVKLQKTLSSFGVEAKVINITKGPTVTRYELSPNTGVKVSKIVNLADDIALNLAAKSIRIEAPIPGKAAVGIEVPNENPESVFIREVIESNTFEDASSTLTVALGKDAAGDNVVADLGKMPHVLIAGATGSGKSVCINSLIVSLIYKSKPSEVKLILVDPKMVELSGYNGVPHLLIPVVTDPKKAAGALNWAVQEMQKRYGLFASKGVKDIKGYNALIEKEGGSGKLPKIVIIIDELADLMMVAPNDVEDAICRLAQMARAAGMHLVIATQRPSVDVITGIIKANVPSRIAFTVSSNVDSRTILDMGGAEKLLGKGDMLYFPVGATKPQRIQGTWISESEIEGVVTSVKKDAVMVYNEDIIQSIDKIQLKSDKSGPGTAKDPDDIENPPSEDPLLNEAIDLVTDLGQASASMLQRRFKIGYSRAGRIIDQMEERGLISGYDGSKPRQLLITKAEWQEQKFKMEHGMKEKEESYDEDETSNENSN